MRTPLRIPVLFLMFAALLPINAASQESPRVIIIPRVGAVIDSVEAETYNLYGAIKDFHSASFFQKPDSTFSVAIHRRSPSGVHTDSMLVISFASLQTLAEWVEHREELRKGTYNLGSSQPLLLFEDGSPVRPPPAPPRKPAISPPRIDQDTLPLAPNMFGLQRPVFQTIHLDFAIGLYLNQFSELQQLTGSSSNISVPLSFHIHIPIVNEPSFSFLGGWGIAIGGSGGGTLNTFSAVLLFSTNMLSLPFDPIIGAGVGHSIYEYHDGVVMNASVSYPVLVLGTNIVRHSLDVCFVIPFSKSLTTEFESKSYSIQPAGPGVVLLLSL